MSFMCVGYRIADISVLNTFQNGEMIDTQVRRFGFRTVEVIQEPLVEPDQYGTGSTFLFEINGVRMFMGGSSLRAPLLLCQCFAESICRLELGAGR
jgi:hypothetical protein